MFVCRIVWPVCLQCVATRKIADGTGWTARLYERMLITSSIGSFSMARDRPNHLTRGVSQCPSVRLIVTVRSRKEQRCWCPGFNEVTDPEKGRGQMAKDILAAPLSRVRRKRSHCLVCTSSLFLSRSGGLSFQCVGLVWNLRTMSSFYTLETHGRDQDNALFLGVLIVFVQRLT
jgi:hypothetical protein